MSPSKTSSKWIEGLSPGDGIAEAAHQVLALRLAAVWERLPAAAFESEADREHVHQLRVASRRAQAALEAFQECLPRRRGRKLEKRLHRVRRAAGEARDLDVQLERLERLANGGVEGADLLATRLEERRRAAQGPIIETLNRLEQRCFPELVQETLSRLHAPKDRDSGTLGPFAGERLHRAAEKFFTAEAAADDGYAALHWFRIRAKRLRYTLEIFASIWPADVKDEAYPVVEQVQELLGDVVDRHVAIERYETWRRRGKGAKVRTAIDELLRREQDSLEQSLDAFTDYWTRPQASALAERLRAIPSAGAPRPELAG